MRLMTDKNSAAASRGQSKSFQKCFDFIAPIMVKPASEGTTKAQRHRETLRQRYSFAAFLCVFVVPISFIISGRLSWLGRRTARSSFCNKSLRRRGPQELRLRRPSRRSGLSRQRRSPDCDRGQNRQTTHFL